MTVFLPHRLRLAADQQGDKAAFRFGDTDLSYGSLVERSNQLANALRANGVGRGDLVGILMGKALENAVAVYGIMAAGAAYVPLDPSAPVAAGERVINECALRHLVVDADRLGKARKLLRNVGEPCTLYGAALPEDALPENSRPDEALPADGVLQQAATSLRALSWDEIATHSTATPTPPTGTGLTSTDDDLAYLIFTSGSTGTPKGIMHTHRSGSAYATMAAELYGVGPEDRLSNFPPLHFDQSTFDFFSGPVSGATTVIIGKEHQLVPASLSQLIERERLTIWYSVPLALVQLLLYGVLDERDCSSLRWVVYGGEPFPLKHLQGLMKQWPHARFSNCYGPAETNQCTYHHLEPLTDEMVAADSGVPIGVACPGMETLVVDDQDRPVSQGDGGELLVHSPTTMQGYWGKDELNQRVFHHRPGADPQTGSQLRYYRTGDVVRVNDDGLLEFLGRGDRQIKTRGFRVELDEVEAVLMTHDEVKEVAVTTARDEQDDSVTILAFVSTRTGDGLDAQGLQRHAARRLARYAVPSSVTFVNDFPRTTSGKIDYPALTDGSTRSESTVAKKQGSEA